MTDEVLAGLEQAVIVRPGDTLIVRVGDYITPEQTKQISSVMEERLPEVKVMVLGGVEEMAVYRPEPRPETRVELDYDRLADLTAKAMQRALSRSASTQRRTG